jgi:hypothetical protein
MNADDKRLHAIKFYKMNEMEGKAYKLSLHWLDLSKKYFPDYNHTRYTSKNDPRQGALFRYCYKVIKEKDSELSEENYHLYIRAQLEILKAIAKKVDEHPIVDICVIAGEPAWRRWSLWKKKYNKVNKAIDYEQTIPEELIIKELNQDKINIEKKKPDDAKLKRMFLNKEISPYYIILKNITSVNIPNYSLFKSNINPNIVAHFEKLFG